MTRHRGQHRIDPRLQPVGCALIGQIVQNVADQRAGVQLADQRRGFAHGDGATAKGLDHQTKGGQIIGDVQDAGGVGFRKLDDFRDQQGLGRDAIRLSLGFQPLIDQPLMGGVLIEAPLRGYDGLSYYYYQSPGSMPAEIIRDSTTGGDLPSMETYI